MYLFNPTTKEIILNAPRADWMGVTEVVPPEFDPVTQGCFFIEEENRWKVVDVTPTIVVPTVVTMRQARLALLGAGLLDAVNEAIADMSGVSVQAAQIEWEYAASVERDSVLIRDMAGALGLTAGQIDELFIAASAL